jgi:hypothetical protein
MNTEENVKMKRNVTFKTVQQSSAVYGIGLIGALVYFIQHAVSFWMGVLGIVKAIFWPAIVVYKILEYFQM